MKRSLKGWISSKFKGEECGVTLLLEPDVDFGKNEDDCYTPKKKRNFRTFAHYYLQHKRLLLQIIAGMLVGMGMQFIFPFLTQAMVDVGIGHKNFNIVTLILIAQIVLFIAQLSVDFIRSWVLLHINDKAKVQKVIDFLDKNHYPHTLDYVGFERIRRAAKKIHDANPLFTGDLGFKHYTLEEPKEDALLLMEKFDPVSNNITTFSVEDFGLQTVLRTWLVADGYGLLLSTC